MIDSIGMEGKKMMIPILLSKPLEVYVKQNILQDQTSFHHDKQHGFIGSVGNITLTKIVLTTNCTIGCANCDRWCQMAWQILETILLYITIKEFT